MDYSVIKARHQAVRAGSTTVEHAVFQWVAPTEGDMRRYASKPGASTATMGRDAVVESISGWSGVLVCDLIPEYESESEPLSFSRDAVAALMDVHVDWLDRLTVDVFRKYDDRKEAISTEKKKRETGSTGIVGESNKAA